jgi:hypothetical protein
MEESDDAEHLVVFHGGEGGHAFIGAAGADERREQVAMVIMADDAGALNRARANPWHRCRGRIRSSTGNRRGHAARPRRHLLLLLEG